MEEECDDDVFRNQHIHIDSPSKIKVIMTCMRLMLRKDVLEQKVNQVLESVGYSSRGLVYTVYFTIQSTKKYSNGNVLGACLHGA